MSLQQGSPGDAELKVGLEVMPIGDVTLSDGRRPEERAPAAVLVGDFQLRSADGVVLAWCICSQPVIE